MIKGVLFDLDNTLADFLRMKRLASEEAARAMIAAGAQFSGTTEEVARQLFEHYLDHGIESDTAFTTFLEKNNRATMSYGQHKTDRILGAGINAYLRAKDTLLSLYPGVRPMLVELTRRGIRLGVVTDAPRLKAWQRLAHLGVEDFFEVVVTSDDTNRLKPDPTPFRRAVEALGLKPMEVLMVGDWPSKDIAGASDSGLKTAFAAYGARAHALNGDDPTADVTLESAAELIARVEELNAK